MDTVMQWASETDEKMMSQKERGDEKLTLNEEVKKMDYAYTINLGIVVSEFNFDVTYAMLELAKEHANFLEVNVKEIVKVPGVFDIPLAVKKLFEKEEIDAVVALGAVIEGQTSHDEIIAHHTTRKIVDLSLEYGKPIGLGISGPGMSRLEAHERVEYAKRAVEAAVKMCKILKKREGYEDYSDTEEKAFEGLKAMG